MQRLGQLGNFSRWDELVEVLKVQQMKVQFVQVPEAACGLELRSAKWLPSEGYLVQLQPSMPGYGQAPSTPFPICPKTGENTNNDNTGFGSAALTGGRCGVARGSGGRGGQGSNRPGGISDESDQVGDSLEVQHLWRELGSRFTVQGPGQSLQYQHHNVTHAS